MQAARQETVAFEASGNASANWDAASEQLEVERLDVFGLRRLGVVPGDGGNGVLDMGWRSAIVQ